MASLWSKKARLWVNGRKDLFGEIQSGVKTQDKDHIWVHCSSLGEFEQGRPVIEDLKLKYPGSNIILTFFSPSGYEVRRNYNGAAAVFYLPMDSRKNAARFLDMVKPRLAIFIKYDYWYYYLNECKKRNIPLLMVSAIFRKQQPFFKWYGGLHRQMLDFFNHFFVQDNDSLELLKSIKVNNATIAGDTRFDRVLEIVGNFKPIDEIQKFCRNSQVLVAGSTWPDDEEMIKEATKELTGIKVIIAPHEIHAEHLQKLKTLFPGSIFHSQLTTSDSRLTTDDSRLMTDDSRLSTIDYRLPTTNILIIDNIGMLSRLYHYGTITYIGGGLNKGIHNTLEAAAWGKPVLFGPNHKKFKEAIGLIEAGGGICIASAHELTTQLKNLVNDQKLLENISKSSFDFVNRHRGATEKIIRFIQENLRFTS